MIYLLSNRYGAIEILLNVHLYAAIKFILILFKTLFLPVWATVLCISDMETV